MTERERLIELVMQATSVNDCYGVRDVSADECESKAIADYLLANGVIVPPCKIGTIVYEIRAKGKGSPRGRFCDYSVTTNYSLRNAIERGLFLYIKQKLFVKTDMTRWGKTVFLTRDEAERAVKGENNEQLH